MLKVKTPANLGQDSNSAHLWLRVKDLQSREGVMHFRVKGKRDKVRFIPVNAAAQRLIEEYLALTGHRSDAEGALFRPVKILHEAGRDSGTKLFFGGGFLLTEHRAFREFALIAAGALSIPIGSVR